MVKVVDFLEGVIDFLNFLIGDLLKKNLKTLFYDKTQSKNINWRLFSLIVGKLV